MTPNPMRPRASANPHQFASDGPNLISPLYDTDNKYARNSMNWQQQQDFMNWQKSNESTPNLRNSQKPPARPKSNYRQSKGPSLHDQLFEVKPVKIPN